MIGNYSFSRELNVDEDIQRLKQPLSRFDLMTLRQKLLRFGCTEPILVWDNIIIDGKNRYDICKSNNIAFRVSEALISSKEEAIVVVCKKQLLREDITYEMRKYLIGKLYLTEVSLKASKSFNTNKIHEQYVSGMVSRKQDIVEDVAAYLGVCVATIQKYTVFTKCVDSIRKKDPDLSQRILDGRVKISHSNLMEMEKFSSWELKLLRSCIREDTPSHIARTDISKIIQRRPSAKSPALASAKHSTDAELPIRKMPEYDPDSEISNLIYTIPAWINSIVRSQKNTDFQHVTPLARERTLMQLSRLEQAIVSIEDDLRKDY